MKTDKAHERKREEFNRLCEEDYKTVSSAMKKFKYSNNIKTSEVKELLGCQHVSKRNGVFTVREGFFYAHGRSEEDLVNFVKKKIPSAEIVDAGMKYFEFKVGASISKQSHWYVTFTL